MQEQHLPEDKSELTINLYVDGEIVRTAKVQGKETNMFLWISAFWSRKIFTY
jgi:hypothetical protein